MMHDHERSSEIAAVQRMASDTLEVMQFAADARVLMTITPPHPEGQVGLSVSVHLTRAEADELMEALRAPAPPMAPIASATSAVEHGRVEGAAA